MLLVRACSGVMRGTMTGVWMGGGEWRWEAVVMV